MDMFQDNNFDEQIKMIKLATIAVVLDYRFPGMNYDHLAALDIETLDEIIDRISEITQEEIEAYQPK